MDHLKKGDQLRVGGIMMEVDDREVWRVAKDLLDRDVKGERKLIHTHYDKSYVPIFSAPDVPVMRNYFEGWGFECRVVSWVPNKVFIFKGVY